MSVTRRTLVRLEVLALIIMVALAATVYVAMDGRDLKPPNGQRPTSTATPRPTALSADLDAIPLPGDEGDLPRRATALPPTIKFDANVQPLSASPVRRALALLSRYDPETLALTVLVLGDDGSMRFLDVASPTAALDAQGNPLSPFRSTTLAPDGTLAAFPQRDHLLLVDLTTATTRRIAVPGFNETVLWRGQQLYVIQSGNTVRVDVATGRVSSTPFLRGFDVIASVEHSSVVRTLEIEPGRPPTLQTWASDRLAASAVLAGLPSGANWWGSGFDSGEMAARALTRPRSIDVDPAAPASSVVAIDTHRGVVLRQLLLTTGAASDHRLRCCVVLGWLDSRTVLVHLEGADIQWILAWGIEGGVWLVSDVVGAVSVEIALSDLPP